MNVSLDGETVLFPCIGDPIAQVKSPAVLTAILARRGCNAMVVPAHVGVADFGAVVDALAAVRNVAGMLVTVPHKFAAVAKCSAATERARFVRSVNVMRRTGEGWFGDATDGQGYLDGIELKGLGVAGKRVLLVGCGGAGSAIALETLERGAAELALHDVDADRREQLLSRLSERFPGRVATGGADPTGFDLIASATPLGMRAGDPLPVDVSRLEPHQFVACVVTKPEMPPLIAEARARGCRTMTGTEMFEAQSDRLVDFLTAAKGRRHGGGRNERNSSPGRLR